MSTDLAKVYGDHWRSGQGSTQTVAESEIFETVLAVIRPGGALLDAGCGSGTFLKLAAPLFARACGVDIAVPAVNAVRALGFDAVEGDVSGPLSLADGSFDACVCLDVIEHVFDPLMALKEIHRVLKPCGQLVLSTPNIRCFRHIARLLFSGEFPRTSEDNFVWGGGHLHYFTHKDVLGLLGAAGFTGGVFALNPGQFGRSWKRKLVRQVVGERLFGEFVEGSVLVACFKGD